MPKRITLSAPIQGGPGLGLLTPAGNPWTVPDAFADEAVNRRLASYTDPQPRPYQLVFQDPLAKKLYGADGQPIAAGGSSVRHTRGVWKPFGCQGGSVEAYGVRSVRIKLEAEAPFSRVRMYVLQRGAYGSSGWKFAVGPTDTWALDTVANAFHPRQGATVRNDLQDASNPIGFARGTWGGGGRVLRGIGAISNTYAGADKSGRLYPGTDWPQGWQQTKTDHALGDVMVSDWVHCRSVAPATTPPSGINRHFMVAVVHATGGAFPIERYDSNPRLPAAVLTGYNNWSSGDVRSRLLYARTYAGGDGVADFNLLPAVAGVPNGTAEETIPTVFFEFDYDVPVESFGAIGDSNTEGYAWPYRAAARLSTPEKPVTMANLGMSSNRSCQYFTMADNMLSTGIGFNNLLIPSHSTNDATNTKFDVDRNLAQLEQRVMEAFRLGIKPWIWTHFFGVYGPPGTPGNDPEIMAYLDRVRALCAATGAVLIDTAASWIRATMLSGDNTHPNAAGIDMLDDVCYSAMVDNLRWGS